MHLAVSQLYVQQEPLLLIVGIRHCTRGITDLQRATSGAMSRAFLRWRTTIQQIHDRLEVWFWMSSRVVSPRPRPARCEYFSATDVCVPIYYYHFLYSLYHSTSFFLKSLELPVVHFCVSFFAPFHAATRSLFDETQTDTITWRWPEMKCLVPRMTLAIFDLVVFSMSFISIFFHIFIFSSSVLFFLPLPKGYLREAAGFHSFSEQERWTVTELRCTIGGWAWKPRWIKSKANQKRGKGAELFVCVIGYLSIYLFIFLFFLPESQYAI